MSIIKIKGLDGRFDRRGFGQFKQRFLFENEPLDAIQTAALPIVTGLPCVERSFDSWEVDDFSFYVWAHFEGIAGHEPGPERDQTMITHEDREEPIELFPRRDILISQYGAYIGEDGRLEFPQYLTRNQQTGAVIGASDGTPSELNPLYGLTTYPVRMLVAKHSYVRFMAPPAIWERRGTVVKRLPSAFAKHNPPKTTWIVAQPNTCARGNNTCVELVETYKELNEVKHIEALQVILQERGR